MKAEIYITTEDGKLCRDSIFSVKDPGEENQVLNIYKEVKDQIFEGFGGAVTDAAGYVFSLMTPEQQEEMLNTYFNEDEMGYVQVRIHMDSCDFSTHMYEQIRRKRMRSWRNSHLKIQRNILCPCWKLRRGKQGKS